MASDGCPARGGDNAATGGAHYLRRGWRVPDLGRAARGRRYEQVHLRVQAERCWTRLIETDVPLALSAESTLERLR